jgi:hypothetical protein
MTRAQALSALQAPALDPEEVPAMLDYIAKKLRLARAELDAIIAAPPRTYRDYPNSENSRSFKFAKRVYKAVGGRVLKDGLR